jgi:cyclic lactone autoinducer peptide
MKVKKTAMKTVAAIATKTAQANANQRCAWLIHQAATVVMWAATTQKHRLGAIFYRHSWQS